MGKSVVQIEEKTDGTPFIVFSCGTWLCRMTHFTNLQRSRLCLRGLDLSCGRIVPTSGGEASGHTC